jgi:hypothetical protein
MTQNYSTKPLRYMAWRFYATSGDISELQYVPLRAAVLSHITFYFELFCGLSTNIFGNMFHFCQERGWYAVWKEKKCCSENSSSWWLVIKLKHLFSTRPKNKNVPLPLSLPQTSHGLAWDLTRTFAVRGRRLAAWAMAGPEWRTTINRLRVTNLTDTNWNKYEKVTKDFHQTEEFADFQLRR